MLEHQNIYSSKLTNRAVAHNRNFPLFWRHFVQAVQIFLSKFVSITIEAVDHPLNTSNHTYSPSIQHFVHYIKKFSCAAVFGS